MCKPHISHCLGHNEVTKEFLVIDGSGTLRCKELGGFGPADKFETKWTCLLPWSCSLASVRAVFSGSRIWLTFTADEHTFVWTFIYTATKSPRVFKDFAELPGSVEKLFAVGDSLVVLVREDSKCMSYSISADGLCTNITSQV